MGALPSGITNYKVLGDPFNLILILTNHINNYNSLAWLELGHLLTEFQPLLLAGWSGLSSHCIVLQSSPPPRDQQTSASTVERYKLEWGGGEFLYFYEILNKRRNFSRNAGEAEWGWRWAGNPNLIEIFNLQRKLDGEHKRWEGQLPQTIP